MHEFKRYFSLVIVFWGATNLSQISVAQYHVPMQPPVPRHDTMFPRRNHSADQNQGSDTSGFSLEQVREFANDVNAQLNGSPRKEEQLRYICSGNGDSVFRSKGFSSRNIVIFKNELGC